jgi:hypothetical protein
MKRPRRLTIEDMRSLAKSKGGKCLSGEYSSTEPLSWECALGHQWESLVRAVRNQGSWCPHCGGSARLSLDDAKAAATERGGRCLSKSYENTRAKMLWECANGHRWEAPLDRIRRNHWCPDCSPKAPIGIQKMREIATRRGGKCLSREYVNGSRKLKWECANRHQWEASASSIVHGDSWCPHCAGTVGLTIEEMLSLAEDRGGRCLSSRYRGGKTSLRWECSEGHQWNAMPGNVKRGSWCPSCSEGLGERLTRIAFEQLFEEEFPKIRPDWLHMGGRKGKNLELDGYCEKLRIAFEHQGRQHFVEEASFSPGLFEDVRKRDAFKRKACKQNGVTLIEVPEVPSYLPVAKMKDFIRDQCEKLHILLPEKFDETRVNFDPAFRFPKSREMLERVRQEAADRGGRLLSDHYVNNSTKMRFRCSEGHEFSMHWGNIGSGHWCKRCSLAHINDSRRHTLDVLRKVAKERGGRCLATSYRNAHEKVLWECELGHQWNATTHNVKNGGHWCPRCAGRNGS